MTTRQVRCKTNAMKPSSFLFLFCLVAASVAAQTSQPLSASLQALQPQNIFPANAEKTFLFSDKTSGAKPATFSATSQNNRPLFTAEVFSAGKSHFEVQSSWRTTGEVKRGDVLLARITVRSLYAKQESGDAVLNFFFQQAVAPFERTVLIEMRIGPEWKTFDIPFAATTAMASGEGSVGLTYGALAQKVEIAGIEVFNFGTKASLAQLPATKFSYAGRERDAAWRTEALKRIDSLRTAPLVIQVNDAKGKPVSGATVTARLVKPAFIFGTAASASLIVSDDSDAVIYKRHLLQLFNSVTLDNNLKWPEWRDPKKQEITKRSIEWILKNGLRLRGHNLVWPGRKFSPSVFAKQADFGPGFADSIIAHIRDEAAYTKGKVYAWDVINEMVHEKDYFNFMPRSQAVEWFKEARRTDPNATLFINEYGMLNNLASPQAIREYLGVIAELRNGGAPIDAIGVQGHVGRQPRSPKEVLSDLDLFTPTGLPVQITEFDINSPDEDLQADYTRDFLIAVYSHPVVNGFTMWGFWEPAHWKPDAAMYKKDWSSKPNAAAWQEWVVNKWKTSLTATTDKAGGVKGRGHLGKYEITITKGTKTVKKFYQLTKQSKAFLIKL